MSDRAMKILWTAAFLFFQFQGFSQIILDDRLFYDPGTPTFLDTSRYNFATYTLQKNYNRRNGKPKNGITLRKLYAYEDGFLKLILAFDTKGHQRSSVHMERDRGGHIVYVTVKSKSLADSIVYFRKENGVIDSVVKYSEIDRKMAYYCSYPSDTIVRIEHVGINDRSFYRELKYKGGRIVEIFCYKDGYPYIRSDYSYENQRQVQNVDWYYTGQTTSQKNYAYYDDGRLLSEQSFYVEPYQRESSINLYFYNNKGISMLKMGTDYSGKEIYQYAYEFRFYNSIEKIFD